MSPKSLRNWPSPVNALLEFRDSVASVKAEVDAVQQRRDAEDQDRDQRGDDQRGHLLAPGDDHPRGAPRRRRRRRRQRHRRRGLGHGGHVGPLVRRRCGGRGGLRWTSGRPARARRPRSAAAGPGSRSRASSSSAACRPRSAAPEVDAGEGGQQLGGERGVVHADHGQVVGTRRPRRRPRGGCPRRSGRWRRRPRRAARRRQRSSRSEPRPARGEGEVSRRPPGAPPSPGAARRRRRRPRRGPGPGVVSTGPLTKPIRRRPVASRCSTASATPAAELARTLSKPARVRQQPDHDGRDAQAARARRAARRRPAAG